MNPESSLSSKHLSRAVWATLVLMLLAVVATAQGEAAPAALRAAILLRALQYERTFASSTEPALILILSGDRAGDDGAQVKVAFRELSALGNGRRIMPDELRGAVTASELQKRAPVVLYVAEGNDAALDVAATSNALVLCGDPNAVGKGCMLAVEVSGSASRLVVDTQRAREKGFTFDARLLRVARVIR